MVWVVILEEVIIIVIDNGEELIFEVIVFLEYDLIVGEVGIYLVEIMVDNGEESIVLDFVYVVFLDVVF